MVQNHSYTLESEAYDETRFYNEMLKYEKLKKQEYSCIKRTFGPIEPSLVELYREQAQVNRLMSNVSYNYMIKFIDKHEEYTFDINTSSTCELTKIYEGK